MFDKQNCESCEHNNVCSYKCIIETMENDYNTDYKIMMGAALTVFIGCKFFKNQEV